MSAHDELDISRLIGSDDFVPFDLSNNRATLGENAGPLTWNASLEAARDIAPPILDTDEKREAFRSFARDSGGWDDKEIAAWDDVELNALCLQWIAGDIREAFGDVEPAAWDWEEYEKDSKAGRARTIPHARTLRVRWGMIYENPAQLDERLARQTAASLGGAPSRGQGHALDVCTLWQEMAA